MSKRNDWIYIASLAAYSYLFWKQAPGLNFLIMNGILICGLILRDNSALTVRSWRLAAIAALISAFCVAWYGNTLSIFANFTALTLTAAFTMHRTNSLFAALLLGLFNGFTAVGFIFQSFVERITKRSDGSSGMQTRLKKAVLLGGVAFIGIIFFCLYRGSSVLFESLTNEIDFSFISIFWCGFVILGSILLFGFYRQQKFAAFSSADANRPMNLQPKERTSVIDSFMSLESEYFTGIALFALLNVLLLVVNGLDLAFIVGGEQCLPKNVSYSQYVHQGINTLILSILFATVLILVWFRNYHSSNPGYRRMRWLVLVWIFQNMFMIAVTILRNHDYIFVFGLTYKRIGVDVYLLLALGGLALMFLKIIRQKSNAFVMKYFGWICFAVLITSSTINWDKVVFNYNAGIKHRLDMMYANSLSYLSLPEQHKYHIENYEMTGREKTDLNAKTFQFLSDQRYIHEHTMWPSFRFAAYGVYDELMTMNFNTDTIISGNGCELKSIYFFPCYAGITGLSVYSNDLISIGEVSQYKNLRSLDLRFNPELKSISGIDQCNKLEVLDLRGTHVQSYAPLMNMPQLRVLRVDYLDAETEGNLQVLNPNLVIQTN